MVASALALTAHLVGLSGDDDGSSVVMAHLASLCGGGHCPRPPACRPILLDTMGVVLASMATLFGGVDREDCDDLGLSVVSHRGHKG